jgi:hypothetical protein
LQVVDYGLYAWHLGSVVGGCIARGVAADVTGKGHHPISRGHGELFVWEGAIGVDLGLNLRSNLLVRSRATNRQQRQQCDT